MNSETSSRRLRRLLVFLGPGNPDSTANQRRTHPRTAYDFTRTVPLRFTFVWVMIVCLRPASATLVNDEPVGNQFIAGTNCAPITASSIRNFFTAISFGRVNLP